MPCSKTEEQFINLVTSLAKVFFPSPLRKSKNMSSCSGVGGSGGNGRGAVVVVVVMVVV